MRSILPFLSASLLVLPARAQQWTDPGFGTDGVVNTSLDPGYDGAYAMALQPDGRIVITGTAGSVGDLQVLVARYNSDGTLDATFDEDGINTFDIAGDDYGYAIALQPDGKILVAGTSKTGSNTDIIVLRLDAQGQLDASFGPDGLRVLDGSSNNDKANAIAVRPDGRILVAGNAALDGKECMLLAQFDADGTLDPDFGASGILKLLVGTDNCQANALVLLDDGRCVVGGSSFTDDATRYDMAVCRVLADGTLDGSFSDDGKVVVPVSADSDKGYALAVRPDGHVLIGGVRNETSSSQATVVVAQLDADGTPDASFGTDGIASLFAGGFPSRAEDILLQPDGKVLVCGTASPAATQRDAYLCRLEADGTPDVGFGDNGELRYGAPGLYRETPTLVLQPDGKVVIGGIDAGGGAVNALLIRFFPDLTTGIAAQRPEALALLAVNGEGVTIGLPPGHGNSMALLADGAGRVVRTWSGADLTASPCRLLFGQRLAAGAYTLALRDAEGTRSVRFLVPGE